jgi:hypothetical protein
MEIRLLQNLDHGNIVKYLDSIRSDDYLNIILEYVENGSLSSLLGKFQGGGESKGFPDQVRGMERTTAHARTRTVNLRCLAPLQPEPLRLSPSPHALIPHLACSLFCPLLLHSSALTTSRRC